MARANRHHIPGQVWHITHRCHQKAFLFKFARDRKRWIQWLFEAKKRYGLEILSYNITLHHIHLLVVDGEREVIPKSLRLVAGKTAKKFNRRKARKGAFWEDRYPYFLNSHEDGARCFTMKILWLGHGSRRSFYGPEDLPN